MVLGDAYCSVPTTPSLTTLKAFAITTPSIALFLAGIRPPIARLTAGLILTTTVAPTSARLLLGIPMVITPLRPALLVALLPPMLIITLGLGHALLSVLGTMIYKE